MCDCCGRSVPTPYHHDNHNPPYDGYDYCQECYDLGCGGPGDCSVIQRNPKGSDMSNTINDRERLEMQLSLGMEEDGSTLTPERKAELEAQLAQFEQASEQASTEVGTQEVTQQQPQGPVTASDVQAMIAQAMQGVAASGSAPTFEELLLQVDPRDSDTALMMFEWLTATGRLQNIGTINGGGYLFHYQEPKGSSKQGYTPGATKGGRMVDAAVEKARESGAKPRITGLCGKCMSAVEQLDDGSVVLDDETKNPVCAVGPDSAHVFVG